MPAVYRQPQPPNEGQSKRHNVKRTYRGVTSQSPQRLCRVCGQEAAGIYFSALVCLPCKSFFLRCANGKEPNVKCEKKNCKINAATRTICKFCRYKRCLAIGMTRKELPEKADAVNGQELCRVCGDVANGVHFGAVTCEGCKNFFRRSLSEETVICKKGGNCVVNLKTRKGCRGCRYRKCIAAGMSKEAKKPGRRNRPIEIFTNIQNNNNNNNNVAVTLSDGIHNDATSEDVFASYQAANNLEDMETDQDFMGQAYQPFDPLSHNNNHGLMREYRLELNSDGSPVHNTDTHAFSLIDDIVNSNYLPNQVVGSEQMTSPESMWDCNGIAMSTSSESFITLEPVSNLLDGTTVGNPLTQEGPYRDLVSPSNQSSPSWSLSSSNDSNLPPMSPRQLSKIVIASLDGECPVQVSDNCYDFSSSFAEMYENRHSGKVSNDSIDHNTSAVTDFDDSSITLNEALNDVMELLTEELDFTPIANGSTSGYSCDPEGVHQNDSVSENSENSSNDLHNSLDCWLSESSNNNEGESAEAFSV